MPDTVEGPPESLAAFRLPSTDALAGTSFRLEGADGEVLELHFGGTGRVVWTAEGFSWAGSGDDIVDVVEASPEVFFVDIDCADPALDSITVVLLMKTGWALVVHQRRFHPEETWSRGPEVTHEHTAARITGLVQQGEAPARTRELVGRRHLYRYSPHNLYEHIYLNSTKFCGHNVSTFGTPGRADCHPASYYKLDESLYLFGWREYDSAVAMLSLLDLTTGRATAKAHAPEDFLHSANRAIGGFITEITDHVDYPDDLNPL